MAAGAVAGAAAGLFLGRRYRSMDAFLEDMRGRLDGLRDVWNEEGLSAADRARLSADVADVEDLEDDDLDDDGLDDEEFDEFDDDELETEGSAESRGWGDDEDDDEESLDDLDEDELEEDLAAVTRDNGVPATSKRADDLSRQLEERVLRALSNEPVLRARPVEIAVVGEGVVELTGAVHALDEVARASALVRNLPGVSMVLNRLVVRAGGNIDTASVARDPVDAPDLGPPAQ
jgi:hypothetical protein